MLNINDRYFIVSFYKDRNQLTFWGYDSISKAMDDVGNRDIGVWKIKKLK